MLTVSKRKILEPGLCGQGERGGETPSVPGNIPFAKRGRIVLPVFPS